MTEDLGTAAAARRGSSSPASRILMRLLRTWVCAATTFRKSRGASIPAFAVVGECGRVIKKRVLEKNKTADETLRLLYEQKNYDHKKSDCV